MIRILFAAAMLSAAFFPVSISAETGAQDVVQRQETSQIEVTRRHLKSLIATIRQDREAQPVAVNFTRSWLDELPNAKGDQEWRCLSEALYFEARGESVKGQFAVAEVILNRVKSSRFPATLCGVINQGTGRKYQCQFTYTCDGFKEVIAEPKAFERVSKVARVAIDGRPAGLTDGATHYHTSAVKPKWSRVYTRTARIGVHIFYRDNYRTASND